MASNARRRILVVGAHGTLGRAIVTELGARHDLISAGRSQGDVQMDLSDPVSTIAALESAKPLDDVVCAAGNVVFAPLASMKPAPFGESLYTLGIADKLLGQVNLALAARDVLSDGGSITLIGGILSEQPILSGTSASLVNGALESFVRAAAIELARGLRINLVSPSVFTESLGSYGPFFIGFESVPVARAARAFARSVDGRQTGQIYRVG